MNRDELARQMEAAYFKAWEAQPRPVRTTQDSWLAVADAAIAALATMTDEEWEQTTIAGRIAAQSRKEKGQ